MGGYRAVGIVSPPLRGVEGTFDQLVAANVAVVIGGVVTAVLLTAGVSKTLDYDRFFETVIQLGIPARMTPSVAGVVLAAEFGIAAMVGLDIELAALASSGLFLVFGCVGFFAEISGRAVPCSCFGSSSVLLGRGTALRSLALAALAAVMAITSFPTTLVGGSPFGILLVATLIAAGSWFRSWRSAGLPAGYL